MEQIKSKWVNGFIIGTFVSLYLLVSIISTIHVIDFFELSNPKWLAVSLAIGFELGAAASLAALITLDKMNKTLVWALFITITLMQMQGNMYYAFINMADFQKKFLLMVSPLKIIFLITKFYLIQKNKYQKLRYQRLFNFYF